MIFKEMRTLVQNLLQILMDLVKALLQVIVALNNVMKHQ